MRQLARSGRVAMGGALLFIGLGLGVAIERRSSTVEIAALQARLAVLEHERELLFARPRSHVPPRLPPVPQVRVTIPGEGTSP